MSLKTRLRISIAALAAVVVIGLSALYLYDFTGAAIEAASYRADLISKQVKDYLLERIQDQQASRAARPASLAELTAMWIDIVRSDPAIPAMLRRTTANADLVLNIRVAGPDGATLAASSPHLEGTRASGERDFRSIEKRNAFRNLWDLETANEHYTRTLPLGIEGQPRPVFRITVVVQSELLRDALKNALDKLGLAFLLSLAIAVCLGLAVPGLVLHPLERLSHRIDSIRSGELDATPEPARPEAKEFAAVQSKLDLLGQQFRGAQQDASSLRSNVRELLQSLEEAVLVFDSGGRVTMAGDPVQRILGKPCAEILGRPLSEVFPVSTPLGNIVHEAIRYNQPLQNRMVVLDRNGAGKLRLLVNVEILGNQAGTNESGTLVTLRDAETRHELERQLDVSTRLAAIGRLTGGVAHEIKNPLNAMALHLEVLKAKLGPDDPEIDVISKEIKRLDHVVKTFLSFNKPVEMHSGPVDLSAVALDVIELAGLEAKAKGVAVETRLERPQWVNGDKDLLKQAVLNLVLNAIEAMRDGGTLILRTGDAGGECLLEVSDTGPGIPPEIRDKIFDLYFSTKKQGSGIGLAMTFRVVQLHRGNISVSSESTGGASFQLRFPALSVYEEEELARQAHS